jgi:hypothetical protein
LTVAGAAADEKLDRDEEMVASGSNKEMRSSKIST